MLENPPMKLEIRNPKSEIRNRGPLLAAALFGLGLIGVAAAGEAAEKKEKADAEAGSPLAAKHAGTAVSRSPYVHHMLLYDAQEPDPKRVKTTGELVLPFSTRSTCGHCHEYARVSSGWHFNAWDAGAPSGRPGEPWFWTSRKVGVQLPLSARYWPGAYRPEAVGLTPWLFVQRFGRHLPGGGVGEKFADTDNAPPSRWKVTGPLEVNCLGCHSMDRAQDMTEWVKQIADQNMMWAAAATTGVGTVKGTCRRMSSTWSRFDAPDPDVKGAPAVQYDATRFDASGKVLMDVRRESSPERCYFCHTTAEVGPGAPPMWQADDDVHITAGMKCTECHRNGLDHRIVRGYDGEVGGAAFTCVGCHYGAGATVRTREARVLPGRLGAPRPLHRGLPNFHFNKLTCTACHSGPIPGAQAMRVQTSRAHMLEFQGKHRTDDALPVILAPVFLKQANGRVAPHRLVWPAAWLRHDKDGCLQPISPDQVAKAASEILEAGAADGPKPFTREQVAAILKALTEDPNAPSPVYVTGGKAFALGAGGALEEAATKSAEPYTWPLAHNVRPAQQALGSGGCTDCHSADSAFFHGQVPVESFMADQRPTVVMSSLLGEEEFELKVWELSFVFRPLFVMFCCAASGIVAAVLLWYFLRGVGCVSKQWR